MKKLLVAGGTVFVSRFAAEYFVEKGWEVFVLNRNSRPQSPGVTLIEGDRKNLGDTLKNHHFDAVLDITAYTAEDVNLLLDALGSFDDYILISSSAVYPEYEVQPFTEESPIGPNRLWGAYGTNKIAAEKALFARFPKGYSLRPPYLYGPMDNAYREAFVFDCALKGRKFYLPKDGEMKLQFFHVRDLCRVMERILEEKPEQHMFNVGNQETVSVREWVTLCYAAAGKTPEFVPVHTEDDQRNYFSFYDYEYNLGVEKQGRLLPETEPLDQGLKEAFDWYVDNQDKVNKRPYLDYIEKQFEGGSL